MTITYLTGDSTGNGSKIFDRIGTELKKEVQTSIRDIFSLNEVEAEEKYWKWMDE